MRIAILLAVAVVTTSLVTVSNAQWYGSFDAMAVTRNLPSSPVFQRNQVDVIIPPAIKGDPATTETRVGSETVLSANNLDLDFITGGRLTVGNRSGVIGIEGSYMLTDDWTESAFAIDPGGLASPFTPVGELVNATFDNNSTAMITYSTRMQAAEVNLAHRAYSGWNGEASVLYGVKSVWIDESMRYMSTNAMMSNDEKVNVDNWLIGPQLGILIEAPFPGGMLDLTFKVAVTNHSVDKTVVSTGMTTLNLSGSDSGAALVSDIGINGSFFITENLLFRLGYHVLSLSDVALATDNLENLAFPPPIVSFGKDRGLIYQSLYLGLTLRH
jgi:hypothetical protein